MTELTTFAAATLVYTALAMWVTQPSHSCVMVEEPPRHLRLEREVDGEHLARDARRIHHVARRYAAHAASAEPQDGDIAGDGDIERCEAVLARQLATAHDVPLARVHAAMAAEP